MKRESVVIFSGKRQELDTSFSVSQTTCLNCIRAETNAVFAHLVLRLTTMSSTIERTTFITEQQSMNNSVRDNDSHFMLPPSRILIQGSEEYQAALESGALELSLPSNGYVPPRTPSTNLANVGNRTPPRTCLTRVVSPLERTYDDA
jgi:hypothetical protein